MVSDSLQKEEEELVLMRREREEKFQQMRAYCHEWHVAALIYPIVYIYFIAIVRRAYDINLTNQNYNHIVHESHFKICLPFLKE